MDKLHRDILGELRDKIVSDLDVYNIIKKLQDEQVLGNEEVSEIELGESKQQRAQILLDILPRYRTNKRFYIDRKAVRCIVL